MEGESKGPKCVRWTPHLTQSLLGIAWECIPRTRGFPVRLEERWNSKHPNIPSTASALVQWLTRVRRKGMIPSRRVALVPYPVLLRLVSDGLEVSLNVYRVFHLRK